MKKAELKDVIVDKPLGWCVCHECGEILHHPGETLTLSHLAIMEECGINCVLVLDKGEEPQVFKQEIRQKAVSIEDITPGEECPVTLLDENKTVIIEEGALIQKELVTDLKVKGVKELFYQKDKQELLGFQYEKYTTLLQSDVYASIGEIHVLEHPKEKELRAEEEIKQAEIEDEKQKLQRLIIPQSLMFLNPSVDVSTTSLKQEMKYHSKMRRKILAPSYIKSVKQIVFEREPGKKKEYIERYNMWIGKTQEIFTNLKTNQSVPFESIDKLAKDIIESFAEDYYFHLNLTNMRLPKEFELYIISHCVNVCLLSISISAALGYSSEQILEIAIGALLHDIGHVLTYRPLFSKETLDSSEQQKFDQHSILGVSLLKNISRIPKSTGYIICQHHERIDGSGRVLHCTGDAIHDFAKIVAVADTFDIVAGDSTPFKAMSVLVNMGKSHFFDLVCIKAILVSLSLFPIGSLVLLTGNKVGRVIATNGNNFKQPLIRTICRMEVGQMFEIDIIEEINLSSVKGIRIIKEVSHSILERDILKGF